MELLTDLSDEQLKFLWGCRFKYTTATVLAMRREMEYRGISTREASK